MTITSVIFIPRTPGESSCYMQRVKGKVAADKLQGKGSLRKETRFPYAISGFP